MEEEHRILDKCVEAYYPFLRRNRVEEQEAAEQVATDELSDFFPLTDKKELQGSRTEELQDSRTEEQRADFTTEPLHVEKANICKVLKECVDKIYPGTDSPLLCVVFKASTEEKFQVINTKCPTRYRNFHVCGAWLRLVEPKRTGFVLDFQRLVPTTFLLGSFGSWHKRHVENYRGLKSGNKNQPKILYAVSKLCVISVTHLISILIGFRLYRTWVGKHFCTSCRFKPEINLCPTLNEVTDVS